MTYGADFTNLGNIQARTITYNADNMPVQLSYSSGVTTQLTYGGTGERVKKRVNSGGNVTDTYYIGDHFEVRGGETVKYIFAGNLRVAQVKGSTRSFFHKDHLGSSTVMTDASGYVIESTEYMPFGTERSHSGANTSDYKYTDQELDAENGLYNYNVRLYDPFIGRFISPDTIAPEPFNPQSLNRYSYCLNNPLIYVDPSGHVSEEDLLRDGWTYDEETGEWLMPEIVVTTPRLYMCTNGFGGLAYLTSEQILGSWGVWRVMEPVPESPEISNETLIERRERYSSSSAPQGGNSGGVKKNNGGNLGGGSSSQANIDKTQNYTVIISKADNAVAPSDETTMECAYCMAHELKRNITITSGFREGSYAHSTNKAFDLGKNSNRTITTNEAQNAYSKCFDVNNSMAMEETNCFHFQTFPWKGEPKVGWQPGLRNTRGRLVK